MKVLDTLTIKDEHEIQLLMNLISLQRRNDITIKCPSEIITIYPSLQNLYQVIYL